VYRGLDSYNLPPLKDLEARKALCERLTDKTFPFVWATLTVKAIASLPLIVPFAAFHPFLPLFAPFCPFLPLFAPFCPLCSPVASPSRELLRVLYWHFNMMLMIASLQRPISTSGNYRWT